MFTKVNIDILVAAKKAKNESERAHESKRAPESKRERDRERWQKERERDNINKRTTYIVAKKKLKQQWHSLIVVYYLVHYIRELYLSILFKYSSRNINMSRSWVNAVCTSKFWMHDQVRHFYELSLSLMILSKGRLCQPVTHQFP